MTRLFVIVTLVLLVSCKPTQKTEKVVPVTMQWQLYDYDSAVALIGEEPGKILVGDCFGKMKCPSDENAPTSFVTIHLNQRNKDVLKELEQSVNVDHFFARLESLLDHRFHVRRFAPEPRIVSVFVKNNIFEILRLRAGAGKFYKRLEGRGQIGKPNQVASGVFMFPAHWQILNAILARATSFDGLVKDIRAAGFIIKEWPDPAKDDPFLWSRDAPTMNHETP